MGSHKRGGWFSASVAQAVLDHYGKKPRDLRALPEGVCTVSREHYMRATALVEGILGVKCDPGRDVKRMLKKVSRSLGSSSFPTRTGVNCFAGFGDSH
jgi:hypothetical protein